MEICNHALRNCEASVALLSKIYKNRQKEFGEKTCFWKVCTFFFLGWYCATGKQIYLSRTFSVKKKAFTYSLAQLIDRPSYWHVIIVNNLLKPLIDAKRTHWILKVLIFSHKDICRRKLILWEDDSFGSVILYFLFAVPRCSINTA